MSKFQKDTFLTLVLNDKDNLVVSGIIPKSTKFPCLYLSNIENISELSIEQYKGSKLINSYIHDTEISNILSFENLNFKYINDTWYKANYKYNDSVVSKYSNKIEVFVSDEFPEAEGSQLYVSALGNINDEESWGNSVNYGSIGEYQIGSELHIMVKKPNFRTYLNSIQVKKDMEPIVPYLEREKGKCIVNLGSEVLNLINQNKIYLYYQINNGNQIEFTPENGFEYEFGEKITITLDLNNRSGQENIIKTFENIKQKRIEFNIPDSSLLPEMVNIYFYPTFKNPDTNEIIGIPDETIEDLFHVKVSLNSGEYAILAYNQKFSVPKNAKLKYETYMQGFEPIYGEETASDTKIFEFEMFLKAYEVKFSVKPLESEVFVDGILVENYSFTSRHGIEHNLLVVPNKKETNLQEYSGTFFVENDFVMEIELKPKEITLQIIDKETGENIQDGSIEIFNNKKEKLEYTPKTLKQAKFLAGEFYEIHLINKGFREYLLSENFNLKSPAETVYTLELPFWRKPRVTVDIRNKDEMSEIEMHLEKLEDKKITRLTSGTSVDVDSGDYKLTITAIDRNGKEQEQIIEKININDDYVGIFELVEKHKESAMMIISAYPNNSVIEINGNITKTYNGYVGDTVHVKVTNDFNFVSFDEKITIDSKLIEKYIVLERVPWKFVIKPKDSDKDAEFTINDNNGLTYETLHQERIVIIGKLEGKHDWVYNKIIDKNTPLLVELVPEFINLNEPLSEDQLLATIETLMKPKRFYNYLTIGRVFKLQGFNIKSLYTFYKNFGRYCSSKTDYKIYNICKTYFEANPQE